MIFKTRHLWIMKFDIFFVTFASLWYDFWQSYYNLNLSRGAFDETHSNIVGSKHLTHANDTGLSIALAFRAVLQSKIVTSALDLMPAPGCSEWEYPLRFGVMNPHVITVITRYIVALCFSTLVFLMRLSFKSDYLSRATIFNKTNHWMAKKVAFFFKIYFL